MTTVIDDGTGTMVPVPIRQSGGMVDSLIRAADRDTWISGAKRVRMLIDHDDGDGGTITKPGRGVEIDEIGPIMLTPGTYDRNGKELTAPTYDTRFHVNVRLHGYALEDLDTEADRKRWQSMALAWRLQGEEVTARNKSENAWKLFGCELIDPDSVSTQKRVWL